MSNTERKYSKVLAENIYFVKQLDNLGFNRKYIGFYMMVEMMDLLINRKMHVVSFSRQIYPIIAKKYGKESFTVERNIRSLIESCWNMDLMVKFHSYYPEGERPTCRDFIFMVKNYITNQMV